MSEKVGNSEPKLSMSITKDSAVGAPQGLRKPNFPAASRGLNHVTKMPG